MNKIKSWKTTNSISFEKQPSNNLCQFIFLDHRTQRSRSSTFINTIRHLSRTLQSLVMRSTRLARFTSSNRSFPNYVEILDSLVQSDERNPHETLLCSTIVLFLITDQFKQIEEDVKSDSPESIARSRA